MAIKSEPSVILSALAAELKAINKSSDQGFKTNVANVYRPGFKWSDDGMLFTIQPRPFLCMWPGGVGMSARGHTIGERRLFLRLILVGVCDSRLDTIQDTILDFWDDVHRVMIRNQARTYPDSLAINQYGAASGDAPGLSTSFEYKNETQVLGIGVFTSHFDIDYRAKF